MLLLKYIFPGFNGFADPNSTAPLLRLINKASLDRILKFEVYVNEADGQLRAAHLILGHKPISCAFQAPRCVIRAKDPRLHRISIAYEGFVVLEDFVVKLKAIIRDEHIRNPESCNNVLPDESFNIYIPDISQRLSFGPLGKIVCTD